MVRDQLVINNDFAPTFADWAGTGVPGFVDGRSLVPLLRRNPPPDSDWRTAILNEQSQKQRFYIPDYEAVRTKTQTYVRWKTGERELYDLQSDPYQLRNVGDGANPVNLARLKTRLQMLSVCRDSSCWASEGP